MVTVTLTLHMERDTVSRYKGFRTHAMPGLNGKKKEKKKPKKRSSPKPFKKYDYKLAFDKMEAEQLVVDTETLEIRSLNRQGKWNVLTVYFQRDGYPWVKINYKGKRKSVFCHVIMWMVDNGTEEVPEGFDVAHNDNNNKNYHPTNLYLRDSYFNQIKDGEPDPNRVEQFF